MLNEFRQSGRDEQGFTLIEVLVVIMIIGILAAIAVPSFLGDAAKGEDASAKSDARNLLSQAESCYTATQDYSQCLSIVADAGLNNSVNVNTFAASGTNGYVIKSISKSKNAFTITRDMATNPATKRTCSIVGGTANGGCSSSTTW